MSTTSTTLDLRSIEDDILAFVAGRGGFPNADRNDQLDVPLFTAGIISSIDLVELVMHVESAHGLRLTADDLQGPGFQTCRAIAELIHDRKAS